jgi:hypothetical protein
VSPALEREIRWVRPVTRGVSAFCELPWTGTSAPIDYGAQKASSTVTILLRKRRSYMP